MHRHNRGTPQQPAELNGIAHAQADGWNHTHGGGLMVHHTDRSLIGNHGGKRRGGGIARHRNHIQPDRADRGHRLQLIERNMPGGGRIDHASILGYRNKRAGEPAHMRAGHEPALLDRIVEQSKRRHGTVSSHSFQTHFFKDTRY